VPDEWRHVPREEKIELIREALRKEMNTAQVDCSIIHDLLELLGRHTSLSFRHRFITTNWDYLLQRKILQLKLEVLPPWMDNNHVFHLNGTVEELMDNSHRSRFLLEEDPADQRHSTVEGDVVFNKMIWDRTFVVVGMSFECQTDKFLMTSLGSVKDDMPIGESLWIVVNPDKDALRISCARISEKLPHATVVGVRKTLAKWIDDRFPELQTRGVFVF
jgi:hypothetical protein